MQDSNLRMHESKSCALPTWLIPNIFGERTGIRTPDTRLRRALLYPAELCTHILLERETRFELATSTLARLRSTTELFPLIMATWKGLEPSTSSVTGWHSNQLNYQAAYGGTNRARTCDPLLVRQVLSQLSYDPSMVVYNMVRPKGLEPPTF